MRAASSLRESNGTCIVERLFISNKQSVLKCSGEAYFYIGAQSFKTNLKTSLTRTIRDESHNVQPRPGDTRAGTLLLTCGMQPKPSSLRAQAQLSETKTETMRTETVETFELVKVEQKLLREKQKRERERCVSRRYLLHIIVKLIC
ncbi:hypothetical protein TNCV_4604491 [Trichonephila clavipes]|nr:hypothetical protein TNCV_4604491 [Trichonephila clavipes]